MTTTVMSIWSHLDDVLYEFAQKLKELKPDNIQGQILVRFCTLRTCRCVYL